jgi:hypothetical protein
MSHQPSHPGSLLTHNSNKTVVRKQKSVSQIWVRMIPLKAFLSELLGTLHTQHRIFFSK